MNECINERMNECKCIPKQYSTTYNNTTEYINTMTHFRLYVFYHANTCLT